jgi:eukaryotic translation initiation factor 2C
MAAKTGGAVEVHKNDTVKRTAMARRGFGREGKPIRLLSNHFAVNLSGGDAVFYQYSVMQHSEFCSCYSFLMHLMIVVQCLF